METAKLQHAYRTQLIQAGVNSHKAEQVAGTLTRKDLQLIGEIWPAWAAIFFQTEDKAPASLDSSRLVE